MPGSIDLSSQFNLTMNRIETLRWAAAILESSSHSLAAAAEMLHQSGEPGVATDVRAAAIDCRGSLAYCRRCIDARMVQETKEAARQETVTP